MFLRLVAFVLFACSLSAQQETNFPLKKLVLADTEAAALAVTLQVTSADPVYIQGLPLLAATDFPPVITPFVGKNIGMGLINQIGTAIADYAKKHDRLITKVLVPSQDTSGGVLRLVVVFGRFSDVAVRGGRFFSSDLIQNRMGIRPGDEVRLSVLESAVNWANTNPFRRVKVLINPVETQPGRANLIIGVQDVSPWRYSLSADNYGTQILGDWHFTGVVQAGNLWGHDHQATYQFVTTDTVRKYQAHALNYRVPLPWRHFIDLSATYSRVDAKFGLADAFVLTGRNWSSDLKYTIPVRNGDDPIEVHAGLDFKTGDNNLEYGGIERFPKSADIIEFSTGGSIIKHDKLGGTAFIANVNLSPGYMGAHNRTPVYEQARHGATPKYAYATFAVQRGLTLPKGWEATSRLTTQISSANLLGSEQLTAGGPTSVRGFNTNVYAGDYGLSLSNDLLTPNFGIPLTRINQKLQPLLTRFAVFYDYAELYVKRRFPFDFAMRPLASAGVGVRMSLANDFSLNFDYGWQISHMAPVYNNTEHGRGHVKVVLAF